MRIATNAMFTVAGGEIQRVQAELFEAQRQASSEKVANDLKGFNRDAKTLISARSFLARADSYARANKELEARLSTQDLALNNSATATEDLRTELTQAIGFDRGDDVMPKVNEAFGRVLGAMNITFAGRYVFGGVAEDAPPVNAASVNDLLNPAVVDDIFDNAERRAKVQLDPNTQVDAAPLADEASRDVFAVMKAIADQNAAAPFTGPLTPAQKTFLEGQITALSTVIQTANAVQGDNGATQALVSSSRTRQEEQSTYFNQLAGDVENVDLAEVAANLAQAQFQIQAAAEAFTALRDNSLLRFL